MVTSFVSRVHRVRFDVAVQTSNAYRFNLPIVDRAQHGDMAMPLLKPRPEAESKIQPETSSVLESRGSTDLATTKARWITALLGTDTTG